MNFLLNFPPLQSLMELIPAEEAGGGKVILLDRGAYDDMDICIMFVLVWPDFGRSLSFT